MRDYREEIGDARLRPGENVRCRCANQEEQCRNKTLQRTPAADLIEEVPRDEIGFGPIGRGNSLAKRKASQRGNVLRATIFSAQDLQPDANIFPLLRARLFFFALACVAIIHAEDFD